MPFEDLRAAAEAYYTLTGYRYTFLLGRKGRSCELTLNFPKAAIHHLAGLHKTGLERAKNRKTTLDYILSAADVDISPSEDVRARWDAIRRLQTMIESNAVVFRYRGHEFKGSRIQADYLLSGDMLMFFVANGEPVSIFCPTAAQRDQERLCPRYTTLKITRESVDGGYSETLYVSPSHKE